MALRIRLVTQLAALTLAIVGFPALAAAQPDGFLSGNIKYNTGQTVQPIFEGWTHNPDGSFELHFGYLNRNHVEEPHVPIGADNRFEPGPQDRGQPTYFYPRFNRQLFSVTVPKDWGQKELVWTLVVHGRTERAVGWLRADWEIAPPNSGRPGDTVKNEPPVLSVEGPPRLALSDTATLSAKVTDDGLPAKQGPRARGRADGPPAFEYSSKLPPPVNVPQVERPTRPRLDSRLQVEWLVWRGPGPVSFAPALVGADQGQAAVTATFSQPGEYVLRARATDGVGVAVKDLKLVVAAQSR